MTQLNYIPNIYFADYKQALKISLEKHFNKIDDQNIDKHDSLLTAAVYSSQIEGNKLDEETFRFYESEGIQTDTLSFREIVGLVRTYKFCMKSALSLKNLLAAHVKLSSAMNLNKKYIGRFRDRKAAVINNDTGDIVYSAPPASKLETEMKELFSDVDLLLQTDLSIEQVFYFASFLHLCIARIHPFADGNGRIARLAEKWFLASRLEKKAWTIETEQMYCKNMDTYHKV